MLNACMSCKKKTECNKPNFGCCYSYPGNLTVCTCYYFTKELSVVHRINEQRLNISN